MKKHASDRRRAEAEPRSARRTEDRSRTDDLDRHARRRPRRHDDPFLEPDPDEPHGPRHGPSRHDRRWSRHRLRGWEGGDWDGTEPEDDDLEG